MRNLILLSGAAIALAACSSSGSVGSPNAPAGARSAIQRVQSSLDVSAVCKAIPLAHVQKLIKATLPAVTPQPLECDWSDAVKLNIYRNDPTGKDVSNVFGSTGKPLSGVGDSAVWDQPVAGMTVPEVGCRKGTTSIVIQLDADVPDTTLTYTGRGTFTIPAAAAATFAADEGVLCNDAFAAGA